MAVHVLFYHPEELTIGEGPIQSDVSGRDLHLDVVSTTYIVEYEGITRSNEGMHSGRGYDGRASSFIGYGGQYYTLLWFPYVDSHQACDIRTTNSVLSPHMGP